MVSFQCNGCGDIVKKPKLDQHGCYSSFDCIDCSKTFKNPSEYKGHTSCISEAEKYQKGLYKGPKTGANGLRISKNHQPDSLSDKKDTTNTPVSRQSNAQWDRISQPTLSDNVNGYSEQPQNGWRNGRDNHRYNDRGRKNSNWQQNRFTRSSASGANDTPLGISRRSSVDDPVVNEGAAFASGPGKRVDGASQGNSQTEAKGKPPKEKRKPKVVGNSDSCSSQTGKEKLTELDAATAEKNFAVNTDEEKGKKRKKHEASSETGGSDAKEKVRKETKQRQKEVDAEPILANAGFEDKEKTKEKRKEAIDEPSSTHDGGAGSEDEKKEKKEKKRKEKNSDEKSEDIEIPASVEEQTTKVKKRKKKVSTDEIAVDTDMPMAVDAEVVVLVSVKVSKKKKKMATTDSIAETVTHVGKEEKQKEKEMKRREKEVVQGEMGVGLKDKKRKNREEPNDSTAEKKRIKH